jgi:hypothetical protein
MKIVNMPTDPTQNFLCGLKSTKNAIIFRFSLNERKPPFMTSVSRSIGRSDVIVAS